MKSKVSFVCQECGYDSPGFLGKCPECGAWNSLKEVKLPAKGWSASGGKIKNSRGGSSGVGAKPQRLSDIETTNTERIMTGFFEFDTVLGGGIVPGSVMLLAGDPGVGKSTLLLQLALSLVRGPVTDFLPVDARPSLADAANGLRVDRRPSIRATPRANISLASPASTAAKPRKILYISGEESVEQIKIRAQRLKAQHTTTKEDLFIISLTDPDEAIEHIYKLRPDLVVVDSIQTMQSENVAGLSGSIAQVRYSTLHFIRCAKQYNIPTILVGHVTKEGMVAGPMVLSHMVDIVLFLEGEKFAATRILRSLKNRFGPVDEVGIFQMEEGGMVEVKNPEKLFITKKKPSAPGSALVVTMEGTRPFIVELQALVVYSKLPMSRRIISGVDQRRVELLLAVLQKHCHLPVDTMDVYVNVVGGIKLSDPGVDLGICLAVFSSLKNLPIGDAVGIAEVGLLGELRPLSSLEKRVKEAQKLGYKKILTSKTHSTLNQALSFFGKRGAI